jgi:hypothetical protein
MQRRDGCNVPQFARALTAAQVVGRDAEQAALRTFFARFVICRQRKRYCMLSPSPAIQPSMRIPVALCMIRIIGTSGEELARLANLLRCVALSGHD